MNYILVTLIVLLALKILELEKRVSQLEGHDPLHQHKSVLLPHSENLGNLASGVYVIDDRMFKRR